MGEYETLGEVLLYVLIGLFSAALCVCVFFAGRLWCLRDDTAWNLSKIVFQA